MCEGAAEPHATNYEEVTRGQSKACLLQARVVRLQQGAEDDDRPTTRECRFAGLLQCS